MDGERALVLGNYIHDLESLWFFDPMPAVPSARPRDTGVTVLASNNAITLNTIARIRSDVHMVPGSMSDAGNIVVPLCGLLGKIDVHHNFGDDTCAFGTIASFTSNRESQTEGVELSNDLAFGSDWLLLFGVNGFGLLGRRRDRRAG